MQKKFAKSKYGAVKNLALLLVLSIIMCVSLGGCRSNNTASDLSDEPTSSTVSSSDAASSDVSSDASSEETSSETQSTVSSKVETSSVTSSEESNLQSSQETSSEQTANSSKEETSGDTASEEEEVPKTVFGQTVPNFSLAFSTDVHIGQKSSNISNLNVMYQDFSRLIQEGNSLHTVLISGDLTQDSYKDQYDTLLSSIRRYSPEGITTYSTMGNHDARSWDYSGGRSMEDRWAEVWPYFQSYLKDSSDVDTNTPYYHVEIEGNNGKKYDIIVLCTEFAFKDEAHISNKQIVWFGQKLKEISEQKGDQNIIVMCHQPIAGTHSNATNNNIGDQNDLIKYMISQYPQVIYLSGHIHSGLSNNMVYDQGEGTYIDGLALANYNYYHYIEIYDDCIRVRVRSINSQWLNNYETVIWTK